MLPTFVGAGVPRAGTSWLYHLLRAHPDVLMPQRRKEIHYFDVHYDRGQTWYEDFFEAESRRTYSAIGEVTPHYLFNEQAPERIAAMPTVRRVIVILRDPVARAFSHYQWRMRQDNFQGTFEQFLVEYPNAITWSTYAPALTRFFNALGPERLLVLIHERVFSDIPAARSRIAEAIGIDASRFSEGAGMSRVNETRLTRFGGLFSVATSASNWLRRHDLDWLPNLLNRRLGLRRVFQRRRKADLPKLAPETRQQMFERFADDVRETEALLGEDLTCWRPEALKAAPAAASSPVFSSETASAEPT